MEIHPRYTDLRREQSIVQRPKSRTSGIANSRCTMARIAVRFAQDVIQTLSVHSSDVGAKDGKVAADARLGHEILQNTIAAAAEGAAVMMLRDTAAATNSLHSVRTIESVIRTW